MLAASAGLWILCAAVLLFARVPGRDVRYAILLPVCIECVLLLPDFFRERARLEAVRAFRPGAGQSLPAPVSALEAEYGRLVKRLEEAVREEERLRAQREREDAHYYTLWAHQIKTPLAAMRLLAQEGGSSLRDPLLAELFKAEQYVGMALEYLHLGEGGNDLVLARVDLADAVKCAVRRTSALFIHQRHTVLRLGRLEGSAVTDKKWLVFVLEQILTNAVKYTPQGSVSVAAEGETIVVSDTGIGIAEEDLPRVFEWGYTGQSGRSDERSTGVGLYLSRRVLGLLGHTIAIKSEPGQGTCVRLGLGRGALVVD